MSLPLTHSLGLSLGIRCAVGDDWWYYGEQCQHSGSSADSLTVTLAASLSVLAAMLVVTVVSVVCVKRSMKHSSPESNLAMSNVNVEERF